MSLRTGREAEAMRTLQQGFLPRHELCRMPMNSNVKQVLLFALDIECIHLVVVTA